MSDCSVLQSTVQYCTVTSVLCLLSCSGLWGHHRILHSDTLTVGLHVRPLAPLDTLSEGPSSFLWHSLLYSDCSTVYSTG